MWSKAARMNLRRISLFVLGAGFIAAGILHFVKMPLYVRIVPPWLPAHAALVTISGIAEIAGGIGVLVKQTRRAAGIGLIALLIAVFPANLQMALHPQQYSDIGSSATFWARLPLQLAIVAWVWFSCLRSY